jgi:hypothetical protein
MDCGVTWGVLVIADSAGRLENGEDFSKCGFCGICRKVQEGGALVLRMLALILGFAGKKRGLAALHKGNMRQFTVSPSVFDCVKPNR